MSITKSVQETQTLAAELSQKILQQKPGKTALVLALSGDLGAGKTTFLQGLAKGLGIEEIVNSPTFVILKRFEISGSNFKNFYHIDCYRLNEPKEILDLGFSEIINNPQNIVAIEWPEKIAALLPKKNINISFDHLLEDKRDIHINL
jgi:tRNA threonylcarbamoyladenosine biosynthesis protein TsaE